MKGPGPWVLPWRLGMQDRAGPGEGGPCLSTGGPRPSLPPASRAGGRGRGGRRYGAGVRVRTLGACRHHLPLCASQNRRAVSAPGPRGPPSFNRRHGGPENSARCPERRGPFPRRLAACPPGPDASDSQSSPAPAQGSACARQTGRGGPTSSPRPGKSPTTSPKTEEVRTRRPRVSMKESV